MTSINEYLYLLIILFFNFIISFNLLKFIINKTNIRQFERDFTLKSHQKKQGTPTLGGIVFIISLYLTSMIFIDDFIYKRNLIILLIFVTFFYLIGFIDDYLKSKFKSYVGLSSTFRLIIEFLLSILFILLINKKLIFDDSIRLNYFNLIIPISFLYIPFLLVINVGVTNSVNLSDGLDGLASGLMIFALIPFLFYFIKNDLIDYAYLIIALIGSLLAFLFYNINPAKIFMGDGGSIMLGAFISLLAIEFNLFEFLFIGCSFFIFEAISVIIQVIYYKLTKKRIFLMAPFHHHLEKKGIKEHTIVMGLWLYGFICMLISLVMEVMK